MTTEATPPADHLDPTMRRPTDEVTWHSLLEFCHTHIGCLDTEHRAWRTDHEVELGPDGRVKLPDIPPGFQDFLDQRARFGIHDGLDHMERLLEELDLRPLLRRTPVILVGGTNGKGTVATAIADALSTIHHRCGLYTSPHVERFLERIRISGGDPDQTRLGQACATVQAATERLDEQGIHPTYFEVATALAFEVFRAVDAHPWVLEVGLGGRLDATNVVDPVASIITNVGSDHADRLGASIEARAREKAGIMRPGVPCFTSATGPALRALRREALDKGTPLVAVTPPRGASDSDAANLALVRAVVGHADVKRRLRNLDHLDPFTIRLPALPGRFERYDLPGERAIILDTAHNEEAIAALARRWADHAARERVPKSHLLIAQLRDKAEPARLWAPLLGLPFDTITATRPDSDRALDAADTANAIRAIASVTVDHEEDPQVALTKALSHLGAGDHMLIAGSFYLAGSLRASLEAMRRHAR